LSFLRVFCRPYKHDIEIRMLIRGFAAFLKGDYRRLPKARELVSTARPPTREEAPTARFYLFAGHHLSSRCKYPRLCYIYLPL